MVLEEEAPAPEPTDSWGVAVSQPSPLAAPAPPPPPAPAPPPPARVVPPLTAASESLQTRVAMPVPAAPSPFMAAPPPTSVRQSALPRSFEAPTPSVMQSALPRMVAAPSTSVLQSAVPVAGPGASGSGSSSGQVAANAQPVDVPGEHRVIVHTVEGQVKRGAIKDARLGDPQLQLHLANGVVETLPRERVKALFFMRAPGARAPSTDGNKVRVTFKDGRQVAGFSKDHKGATSGFFVVPADNRTNTERIFIFRHAVQSVSIDG